MAYSLRFKLYGLFATSELQLQISGRERKIIRKQLVSEV
jgi:hypothetical protein